MMTFDFYYVYDYNCQAYRFLINTRVYKRFFSIFIWSIYCFCSKYRNLLLNIFYFSFFRDSIHRFISTTNALINSLEITIETIKICVYISKSKVIYSYSCFSLYNFFTLLLLFFIFLNSVYQQNIYIVLLTDSLTHIFIPHLIINSLIVNTFNISTHTHIWAFVCGFRSDWIENTIIFLLFSSSLFSS